jgi:hypothetical protein
MNYLNVFLFASITSCLPIFYHVMLIGYACISPDDRASSWWQTGYVGRENPRTVARTLCVDRATMYRHLAKLTG